jgi:hypothetical protein
VNWARPRATVPTRSNRQRPCYSPDPLNHLAPPALPASTCCPCAPCPPLSVALTSMGEAKLHFTPPCSAAPPRYSATHFRASHHRSGCAKATSSSTARTWASSLNRRPPLGANHKPSRGTASTAKSTSPWTASFGHPLTPPTPLQAPPVYCDTCRPLHHRRRALLRPLTSASAAVGPHLW